MDQSPKPIAYFELIMRFEDGTYNQIQIDAEKDDFVIFYREQETDHTNDTHRKHIPQQWFHTHELRWSHSAAAGPRGQRPGTRVSPRGEDLDQEFRQEETHEGFGDAVRESTSD